MKGKSVIGNIGAVLGRRTWSRNIASASFSRLLYNKQNLISPPPTATTTTSSINSPKAQVGPFGLFFLRNLSAPSGSSNIVPVNSEQEFETSLNNVLDKSLPALFYFTAVWCGPCKFISPIIEELSGKYPHVTIYKVDIDQEELQKTLSKLHVSAVPTLQFYQNGKKTAAIVGADVTKLKDTMEALYG